MESKEESNFVTVKEASQLLQISAKTIYNYIREKGLETKKVNGKTCIDLNMLQDFVKQTVKVNLPSKTISNKEILVDREKWEGMTYKLGVLEERCRNLENDLAQARRLLEYKPIKRVWWKRFFNRD